MSAAADDRPKDADDLAPLVYNELRRLAGGLYAAGAAGPDAAGHRARPRGLSEAGRRRHAVDTTERHFLGIAARSMRQILVERARARGAQKRWAALDRVSLTDVARGAAIRRRDAAGARRGADRLEQIDPEQARSSSCATSSA